MPDDEHKALFGGLKAEIEAQAGTTYGSLEPVAYTKQVVAGMIFQVRYKTDSGDFIHVKVFKPLPHTGQPCQV